MKTNRMEAFSDGVLAIIITIMVLEFKVPEEATFSALLSISSTLIAYVISFVYIAIYWNNHHHVLQPIENTNTPILWANLHLLFWLSLVPFATGWVSSTNFGSAPVAFYGSILLMASVAFFIMMNVIAKYENAQSLVKKTIAQSNKNLFSIIVHLVAIPIAFWNSYISMIIYVGVVLLWIIPHKNFEKAMKRK